MSRSCLTKVKAPLAVVLLFTLLLSGLVAVYFRIGFIPTGIVVTEEFIGVPERYPSEPLFDLIYGRQRIAEIEAYLTQEPNSVHSVLPAIGSVLHSYRVRERPEVYRLMLNYGADPTLRIPLEQMLLLHVPVLPDHPVFDSGVSPLDLGARDGDIRFLTACFDLSEPGVIRHSDIEAALLMAELYEEEESITLLRERLERR